MPRDFLSKALGDFHIYADGTSGDDANDGLTALTPKKNLCKVFALLPDVQAFKVSIHLSGVFDLDDSSYDVYRQSIGGDSTIVLSTAGFFTAQGTESRLVVDGGLDLSVVDDNTGSNYAADADKHSTTLIGDDAASWTVDQYVGYVIEVVTGTAAGQRRTVHKNTANSIIPQHPFSTDPGAGAEFRIMKQATTISASVQDTVLRLRGALSLTAYWQNFRFDGSKLGLDVNLDTAYINSFMGVMFNHSRATVFGQPYSTRIVNGSTYSSYWYYDPDTFEQIIGNDWKLCWSVTGGNDILIYDTGVNVYSFVSAKYARIVGCKIASLSYSCFAAGMLLQGSRATFLSNENDRPVLYGTATQPIRVKNAGGVGIEIDSQGPFSIGSNDVGGAVIEDCGSHAIEVRGTRLWLWKNVQGTGNSGAGVYAHDDAKIWITDGSPPTLTGTVGDLAISNPTLEEATWAEIDGGEDAAIMAESTLAKEVV